MSATIWSTRLLQLCIGIVYLLAVTYVWAGQGDKTWSLASFDRVYIEGNAVIEIHQQGPHAADLVMRASGQPQVLQELRVEVVDGVLYLDAQHVERPEELSIRIEVASLQEIYLNGQGVVAASDFVGQALVLEGVGGGAFDLTNLWVQDLVVVGTGFTQFHMSGHAQHQSIELSGSGEYFGDDLKSMASAVSVRGQGEVNIWAEEVLDIDVHGTAQVQYSGAARVHRRIFGQGAVTRVPSFGVTSL